MDKPSLPPIPRSVFWLVLWSFVLQVAMIGAFHQYRTRPIEDHFAFGWEMGRVARSLALDKASAIHTEATPARPLGNRRFIRI